MAEAGDGTILGSLLEVEQALTGAVAGGVDAAADTVSGAVDGAVQVLRDVIAKLGGTPQS